MPQALNNIDGSVVHYTPAPTNFAGLVADTLGNAGDASDGFEAIMDALLAQVPATDASILSLDAGLSALSDAVDSFSQIETDTWADGFPLPIMALADRPVAPAPQAPGGIQLPSLPPPPNTVPPPPPSTCVPQPPAPPPGPTPPPRRVPPIPVPIPRTGSPCPPGQGFNFTTGKCQPICPPGYSFTSDGNCTPNPVQPSGVPPAPPVQLPPIPVGLPPCPQGFTSGAGGDCIPTDGSDTESKILMVLGDALLQLTSKQVVPVTAEWVASFTQLSIETSVLLVGALIAVAGFLILMLGGGCGEACIDSSKIEQVYEAIGDNLWRVAKAGMMSGPAAVVAITHFMGVGDQALNRLGTSQAQSGEQNMNQVMTNLIAHARTLPANATAPLNIPAAQKLYVSGAGWYPDSISVASQVTTKFLEAMATATPA